MLLRFSSLLLVITLSLPAHGCSRPDEGSPAVVDEGNAAQLKAGRRRVEPTSWDTVYVIGGAEQDTLLLLPRLLSARNGQLYVYDYGVSRLNAFDAAGRLRWQFGRRGGGPEEFGNPLDMEVGPDGSIWLADAGNGRLTRVTASGELRDMLRHEGMVVRDVIPLRGRLLVTRVSPGDTLWLALDGQGRSVGAGRAPVRDLAQAHPIVRQSYSVVGDDSSLWATVFPFGDLLLVYQDSVLRCHGRLVEGEPFPGQPSQEMQESIWAVAAVVADSSVFVLPRGRSPYALRALDEYSARDCRYLRTLPLPEKVAAMAYSAGTFYFEHENPAPTILALRR